LQEVILAQQNIKAYKYCCQLLYYNTKIGEIRSNYVSVRSCFI